MLGLRTLVLVAGLWGLCVMGCSEAAPRRRAPRAVEAGGVPRELLNGLALNGTTFTRLGDLPLSSQGLADNAEVQQILAFSPGFENLLRYMVECALPQDRSISFASSTSSATFAFQGAFGLAADWEEGPCDTACQEWVSACLFARTNAFGLPVLIRLSGDHEALRGDGVDPTFAVQEGAFYGNLFLDQPRQYTCRGAGFDPLYQAVRVCTQHGQACGFTRVGTCGPVDGDTGLASERRACDVETAGAFGECWSRATLPGQDAHPEPSIRYTRVITVHVRPSFFAGGMAAAGFGAEEGPVACGDPAPPVTPADPPDPGPAVANTRCVNDDRCDSELLLCDNTSPQARCTSKCNNNARQEIEQEECGGPEATCLAVGRGDASCTKACDTAGSGAAVPRRCDSGGVCTRFWPYMSDTVAGCHNFCQTAADCGGAPCNPRMGVCGETIDDTLLPDGRPCDPTSPERGCRGACFVVGSSVTQGLCGSYINAALRSRCPDGAQSVMPPLAPGGPGVTDDLTLCLYRSCRTTSDCTAPLVCRGDVVSGLNLCSYGS